MKYAFIVLARKHLMRERTWEFFLQNWRPLGIFSMRYFSLSILKANGIAASVGFVVLSKMLVSDQNFFFCFGA